MNRENENELKFTTAAVEIVLCYDCHDNKTSWWFSPELKAEAAASVAAEKKHLKSMNSWNDVMVNNSSN